jgi:hypothetical protein
MMKCLHWLYLLILMSAVLLLSACGDSESSHGGSWSDATLLADNTFIRFPQLGSDDNGNLIAVWAQTSGFYANRYDAVTGWGTPQQIRNAGLSWSELRIAVNRSGQTIVAWFQHDDSFYFGNVHTIRYSPGAGWGIEENLSGIKWLSDVAIDDMGNVFIVAEQYETYIGGGSRGITIARSNQASSWSYERIEYADPSAIEGFPKISIDGSGNGFVMWAEGYSNNSVNVSRITQAGLGVPQQISMAEDSSVSCPNIAVDNNGNVMALWGLMDSSSNSHTYACRYTPAEGWSAAERIDDSPFDTIDQFLTVGTSGNSHAVWTQLTETGTSDIYLCRFSPSEGWQIPLRAGIGGIARYPRIAADAYGNFFAVWLQYDPNVRFGGDGRIYANRYQSGSGWGKQQQLTDGLGDANPPALVVDRSGKAMAIWSQSIMSVDGIIVSGTFFSRFK